MAQFPTSIFTPRTITNRPGITYDEEKEHVIFSEDFTLAWAEIVAIETILGLNPQGAFTTVSDRILALEEGGGGSAVWGGITGDLEDQTDLQSALDTLQSNIDSKPDILDIYPVGAIYISVVSTSPATLFGGTWSAFAQGRALVGLDSGDTDWDTPEETRGSKTNTIAQANLPAINIGIPGSDFTTSGSDDFLKFSSGRTGASPFTLNAPLGGSGTALNNIQPSIVVYMWKRTA